jgi:hypothetical protein
MGLLAVHAEANSAAATRNERIEHLLNQIEIRGRRFNDTSIQ